MDYIREELLRQEVALAALMTGGEETAHKAEREESAKKFTFAGTQSVEQEAGPQLFAETGLESQPGEVLRGRNGGTGTRERRWQNGGTDTGETWRQSRSVLPYGAESWSTGPAMATTAAGKTAGVREVSRAIQRDARRYDGGFSIY